MLDELPEFDRRTLDGLRQPLESGRIVLRRVAYRVTLPARFQLVAAMNPCPCGRNGDGGGGCRCTAREVDRYRGRVSGPLLDRIDLHLVVPRVPYADLARPSGGTTSREVRERVIGARDRQRDRLDGLPVRTNANIPTRLLDRLCRRSVEAERLLATVVERRRLSARGHARILRVARTVADLSESDRIEGSHLAEAVHARSL
jgi:magnesium chelatase family protein